VLPPSEFIRIAESSNLIVTLDRWVKREACKQAKVWMDAGHTPLVMSVNVSAVQFRHAIDLENDVAVVLANSKLPPQLLELELTETIFMEAAQEQGDVLARLRRSGVKFAIDDFGTGYSSLDYLRRFPVDRIKIAQVFVAGIETDPSSAAIVRAIIALARELNIVAIAEGVETARQVELLKGWGCPQMQGYYFARPLVADDFALLMRGGEVIASKTIAPRAAA
jgi:EAL domain-containing protein (putative c-di-GMP-specific phosphodiesterase class I)